MKSSIVFKHSNVVLSKLFFKETTHFFFVTCVAVVLIEGLKVKKPCRSSSRSSPAALNICSRGVPGKILKDT